MEYVRNANTLSRFHLVLRILPTIDQVNLLLWHVGSIHQQVKHKERSCMIVEVGLHAKYPKVLSSNKEVYCKHAINSSKFEGITQLPNNICDGGSGHHILWKGTCNGSIGSRGDLLVTRH